MIAAALSLWAGQLDAQAAGVRYPLTFEYVYEHNTADLIENHHIVIDSVGGRLRGWYYGTSDEFDQAREGYLLGFFVMEMQDLVWSADRVAFTLRRPGQFFTAPVPLRYRSVSELPPKLLKKWEFTVTDTIKRYAGSKAADRVALRMRTEARVFRLLQPVRK